MSRKVSNLDKLIRQVEDIFVDHIPFNKLLGMHIESLDFDCAKVRIDMREELVGNFIQGILHGGVIASVLDVTGGMTAFLGQVKKMGDIPDQAKLQRLATFGTIDLRVDYLRPGKGKYFISEGRVLRAGSKVVVTRMELFNEVRDLIAAGIGTYVAV